MKLIARSKAEQNQAAIDPWTLVHVGVGLGVGLAGFGAASSAAMAIGYEFFEHYAEGTDLGQQFFQTSGPEHPVNSFVDVAVFMAAWYAGHRWNQT